MLTRSSKEKPIFIEEIEKFCKSNRKHSREVKKEEMDREANANANANAPRDCMTGVMPIFDERPSIVRPDLGTINFRIDNATMNALQGKQFLGKSHEDPTRHLRNFINIADNFRITGVQSEAMRHLLFPYTLEGEAREWLERQPPGSMATWQDVVAKFLAKFFSPGKTMKLIKNITNFEQKSTESLAEAWERFKGLLRDCPHHGLPQEHIMRTFFGGLFEDVQAMLNSTSAGMFLRNSYYEAVKILKNLTENSFQVSERDRPRKQVNYTQGSELSDLRNLVMQKFEAFDQKFERQLAKSHHVNVVQSDSYCNICATDHGEQGCPMLENEE
jgi:Retrotransposon gag protein